jgi:serine protease Do
MRPMPVVLVAATAAVLVGFGAGSATGQTGPPATFAGVVEAVAPAVVTLVPPAGSAISRFDDDEEDGDLVAPVGSGIIVDPRGIVLTNARVAGVRGVEVLTADGRRHRPIRVALDTRSDLGILVIGDGASVFPSARLADSDRIKVGDWVVAMGTPLGLRATVSAGVVSARVSDGAGSDVGDYLLTTAVMRFGSTGGPLVDVNGQVVGINTMFASEAAGLAFTIPSNVARTVVPQLLETGRVSRAGIGLVTQALTPELARALGAPGTLGLVVADVIPGGPAAAAGLQPGDIMLAFEAVPLLGRLDLARALQRARPGQEVALRVRRRGGRETIIAVRLTEDRDEEPTSLVTWPMPELGFEVRSLTPTLGVVVSRARRPALDSGLRAGDIVRDVNHEPVRTVADFARIADQLRAGRTVALLVQRGRVALYVALSAGMERKASR